MKNITTSLLFCAKKYFEKYFKKVLTIVKQSSTITYVHIKNERKHIEK